MTTDARQALSDCKRIVIKVGTHILVHKNGRPNRRRIAVIAEQISKLTKRGYEIVLVSSGAIGAGLHTLGIKRRPGTLPELQMAAAIGQTRLIECYNDYFTKHKLTISQVLLTHADLKDRGRHLNARNTLLKLLEHRVLPIINENDVVAVDEIQIGDNDVLSALVGILIDADLLILLTTPNGLRAKTKGQQTKRIDYLPGIDQKAFELVGKKTNTFSTGGMETKLRAAKMMADIGKSVVIASGLQPNVLTNIIQGDDVGTLIGSSSGKKIKASRKRWLAFFHRSSGSVTIDKGAVAALVERNKSLLPSGITKVNGQFGIGSLIDIEDEKNNVIARGLSFYSSDEIDKIKGSPTSKIALLLGRKDYNEVIHRDNLVLL